MFRAVLSNDIEIVNGKFGPAGDFDQFSLFI